MEVINLERSFPVGVEVGSRPEDGQRRGVPLSHRGLHLLCAHVAGFCMHRHLLRLQHQGPQGEEVREPQGLPEREPTDAALPRLHVLNCQVIYPRNPS